MLITKICFSFFKSIDLNVYGNIWSLVTRQLTGTQRTGDKVLKHGRPNVVRSCSWQINVLIIIVEVTSQWWHCKQLCGGKPVFCLASSLKRSVIQPFNRSHQICKSSDQFLSSCILQKYLSLFKGHFHPWYIVGWFQDIIFLFRKRSAANICCCLPYLFNVSLII